MAERLPVDNSDAGVWGPILLGWLLANHDTDGEHSNLIFYEGSMVSWEEDAVANYTYTN